MTAVTVFPSGATTAGGPFLFKKQRMMDEFDDGDISSSTDDCCNYGDDEFNVSDITTSDSDACRPLPIAMDADIKYRHWPLPRQRLACGIAPRVGRAAAVAAAQRSAACGGVRRMPRTNAALRHFGDSSSFDDDSSSRDDISIPPSMERLRSENHIRGLSMIRELSPVLASDDEQNNSSHACIASPMRTSSLNLPFQYTSSRNSLRQPKTNPRISKSTALASSTPLGGGRGGKLKLHQYNTALYDGMERPSSFYDDLTPPPAIPTINGDFNKRGCLSEVSRMLPQELDLGPEFQVVAKNFKIKGALHLTVSTSGNLLIVHIEKGSYFLTQMFSSYVKIELKYRRRHGDEYAPFMSARTEVVPRNIQPKYKETKNFELIRQYVRHLSMTISVWVFDADQRGRIQLGCMTFPLKSMLKKAGIECPVDENRRLRNAGTSVLKDGWYFLLDPKFGEKSSLSRRKICFQTFYDIDSSSSKANSTSMTLARMRSGTFEMPYDGSQDAGMRNCRALSNAGQCMAKPSSSSSSYCYNNGFHHTTSNTDLTTTTNSSISSFNHRFALPSITTSDATSDCTSSSACAAIDAGGVCRIDYHKLFAANAAALSTENLAAGGLATAGGESPKKKKTVVKRASSFTYSPPTSGTQNGAGVQQRVDKRGGVFAPLTKTISYLRHKVDNALSTSTLFPSKEEVKLWGESFDALLNHKYGCLLFRTFLKGEFSDENVDFWLECEQYRKMKEGSRKAARTAKDIYDHFIAEHSPRQVNLDADTRQATKAALETAITADVFSLAQNRIEQLMAKDSYKRFLKSPAYTDLLISSSAASSMIHLGP